MHRKRRRELLMYASAAIASVFLVLHYLTRSASVLEEDYILTSDPGADGHFCPENVVKIRSTTIKNNSEPVRVVLESSKVAKVHAYWPHHQLPPVRLYEDLNRQSRNLPMELRKQQYQDCLKLLRIVVKLFEDNDIEYIMADGTLLGSYIGHDMIAWDDDLDFMVNYKDYPKLKNIYQNPRFQEIIGIHGYHDSIEEWNSDKIAEVLPDFITNPEGNHVEQSHKHKLFFKERQKIGDRTGNILPWSWPFVDIKFYKTNSSHMWKFDSLYTDEDAVHIVDFYPLMQRLFAAMWLHAPHQTHIYLKMKYKHFKCQTSMHNHVKEQKVSKYSRVDVPCSAIKHIYPYVERHPHGHNETLELLWEGDRVRYAAIVYAPCDAHAKPYTI